MTNASQGFTDITYLESVVPVALDGPGDEGHPCQGRQGARGVDALRNAHGQTDGHVLALQRLAGALQGAEGEHRRLYGDSLQAKETPEETILLL